ncbi:MAG: hypothetical protein JWR69_2658 [Pedosphaera sp.]|nr:hypothetical protein [Pedosphaera sp.]
MKFLHLSNVLFWVAILLGSGCSPKQAPIVTEQRPKRWQYHLETFKNPVYEPGNPTLDALLKQSHALDRQSGGFSPEIKIAELGNDGWEMVGCYVEPETVWPDLNAQSGGMVDRQPNFRGGRLVMIFKRPL